MENLRDRTIAGLTWSGAAQIGRQIIQFVVSVILARLLTPTEFGLVSMIIVFTGFAELFHDPGLGSALIQKSDLEQRHLNAVFWFVIAGGTLLSIIVTFFAPFFASFYREPLLKQLTMVLALNYFFNALNVVQFALLQKNMDFQRIARIEVTATCISGAISIGLALSGFGVWSLVAQSLIFSVSSVPLAWLSSSWRPSFSFSINALKELSRFGVNLLGFNVFNYWVRNFDNLLVGKYIGPAALGIYSRAYSFMLLPVSQISNIISRVMFPALSSIQKDIERTKRVYLSATRMIALITFPLMTGLFVTAEPLILLIFGAKWEEIIPIFQILCIIGFIQTIGTTVGWIYTSQGRTDIMFKWGIFSGSVYMSSFAIGLHWGIIGVATAYVLSGYIILWYPSWYISGRLINLRFIEMIKNLSGPLCCAMIMGSATWLVKYLLPSDWPRLYFLALQIVVGVSVYYMLISFFHLRAYEELLLLIREQRRKLRYE